MKNNKNSGFTLLELIITVAIIGILSAISLPAYTQYVQQTKRTEAKAEILRIAQLQESYYIQNLSYAAAANEAGGLGFSDATITTETGLYGIRVEGFASDGSTCSGDNTTPCVSYLIEATPVSTASQANDTDCSGGFRLLSTGLKQARSSTDSGWTNAASRKECWN